MSSDLKIIGPVLAKINEESQKVEEQVHGIIKKSKYEYEKFG